MKKIFSKNLSGIFIAMCLPVGIFAITEILSLLVFHNHLFVSQLDYKNFLRSIGIMSLSSYALFINMTAGRMDLSLGGQQLIGGLIGGNLAISAGFGPIGVIALCVLFATLAGLLSGLMFVILRLPTFITGIGMALIFEAVANAYAPEGLMIYGNPNLTLLSNAVFIISISAVAIAISAIMLTYTKFGIHYQAIKGGMKVAQNSGIRINLNVLICFMLCGALIGLSGVLNAGYSSYMRPELNMSSIITTFGGFTPVFLAMYIQRYCPITISIPFAVLAFKFLSMFLLKFSMPQQASTAITMIILLILLISFALMGRKDLSKQYRARSQST